MHATTANFRSEVSDCHEQDVNSVPVKFYELLPETNKSLSVMDTDFQSVINKLILPLLKIIDGAIIMLDSSGKAQQTVI